MGKKVLGDDPFRSASGTPAVEKPKAKKAKRAPKKKTEAPRVSKPQKAEKRVEKKAAKVEQPVDAQKPVAEVEAVVTQALSRQTAERAFEEPPTEAAPNSWRWWRYRQLQLARAEDASWLARNDGMTRPDRFGRDPQLAGRAEPIVDVLYRSWLRVSVRGLGHVPESGRAILVARRRAVAAPTTGLLAAAYAQLARFGLDGAFTSALDAAVIAHAIRTEHVAHREVRPLVRSSRLYAPLVGKLIRKLGGVPSELHDIARLLDDDRLALTFVGDSAKKDELDLSTIVCLALVTGAPLIPVTIAMSPRNVLGAPSMTAIAFGTPQFPGTEFGPEAAEDRALVARLAGELDAAL